jgi:hypothetical protein
LEGLLSSFSRGTPPSLARRWVVAGAALVLRAFNLVSAALDLWLPPALGSEAAYEKHLAAQLVERLGKDGTVTRKYRLKRSELDIAVEFRWLGQDVLVGLELKKDLEDKKEIQKLRGQIQEYAPITHALFVVLCGETDPTVVGTIDKDLAKAENSLITGDPLVRWSRVVLKK